MKTKELITYVLIIALLYLVMNENENIEGFQWSSLHCRDQYYECARADEREMYMQKRQGEEAQRFNVRPGPPSWFRAWR